MRPAILRLLALAACFLIAQPVFGQVTTSLQVVNKFNAGASYFGNSYSDDQVWLYFINTSTAVTYTNTSGSSVAVVASQPIQLSSVQNGTFSIGVGSVGTRVWAALGATNPFTSGQPQQFQKNIPYALAEWTVNGNSYDNVDVSYEDSFSFPTMLRVVNSSGTSSAGFPAGTQAATVVSALTAALPAPVGPGGTSNPNYPSASANNGVGWSPVSTVDATPAAVRPIGSSKYWISAADTNGNLTAYQYIPSFNDYLGYLQAHTPKTVVSSGTIQGYYVDYSGNGGYSGYVSITGSDQAYGIQVHDIRVNTAPSAANNWQASPSAGTATGGTLTIAANGASLPCGASGQSGTTNTINGNWTDLTIATGASLINGDFASGPVVVGTGDFSPGGSQVGINTTFLASISASMATGLLGSGTYMSGMWADPSAGTLIADPGGTMRWFNTLTREQSTQVLFDKAWGAGQQFYDPYWATLANLSGMQGYLSPFNDRWSNFSPDFALLPTAGANAVTWELGMVAAVPEPSSLLLAAAGIAGLAGVGSQRRRRRVRARVGETV